MRDFYKISTYPDLLAGVTVIRDCGCAIDEAGWQDTLYRSETPAEVEIQITAMPYCIWGNRQPGKMRVWFRTRN